MTRVLVDTFHVMLTDGGDSAGLCGMATGNYHSIPSSTLRGLWSGPQQARNSVMMNVLITVILANTFDIMHQLSMVVTPPSCEEWPPGTPTQSHQANLELFGVGNSKPGILG